MSDTINKGWVAWFASNPVAANLLMVLILVAGLMTANNLRVEAMPTIPAKSVTISVVYESGSASAAEEALAIKIEEALQGVQGIKKITSKSDKYSALVTVERVSGYDLDLLYRDIKTRVDGITTLPGRAERPIITRQVLLEDALTVHLYGDADADVLQETARRLRKQLLSNPVIERVETYGKQTPEITIQIDEQRLQALNLSLEQVANRIADSSLIESGGELFSDAGTLIVKADQQRYHQREFETIVIKETADGQRIRLGDVAFVDDSFEQGGVLSRYNGERAVGLDIKMYTSSDIMAISEQVKEEVAQFRQQLPQGMALDIWNDNSRYIVSRLNLLLENSAIGIALVMLLLALFLNLRVAFWVGVGLPVTFAGAMLLMDPRLFNLTLNELTTFGFIIALGIVVDDAVVVGESVYNAREKEGASLASTIRGAQRVTVPTVFGVLTTIVAFMALVLVEGEMGKIFSFFAYAAAFCLVFSLVESKLILPAHLAHMKVEPVGVPKNPIKRVWFYIQQTMSNGLNFVARKLYRPFIHEVLSYRYAALAVALAVFITVVGLVPSGKVKISFFPDIPSDFIEIDMELEDGAGYGLVHEQALVIEQVAQQLNEQWLEQEDLDTKPIPNLMTIAGNQSATVIAGLSPRTERPFGTMDMAEEWQQQIGSVEGVSKLKFITSWEGAGDIKIELLSENTPTLRLASQQVVEALQRFNGVSGIQNSLKSGQAQIDLRLRQQGQAMGLTIADIASQIQQAYQGYEIQRIQRGPDEVKVKLRYPDQDRRSIDDLANAYIRTADGSTVPLTTVAEISSGYVETEIERINRSRVAVISADVDKSVAVAADILASLQADLFKSLEANYPDLTVKLAGEAQEEAETMASLKNAFIIALVVIYALLAIPLKSYSQPLMIMMAIPFGIVGAILGHWLHDVPLTILSMFGILALSGVVVNDSLLLINRYNELKAKGLPSRVAMVQAGVNRMRAIFLTSITTYAGLMPIISETSEQAQVLIPAAIAMGYGILFATVITLLLIPAFVLISEDFGVKRKRSSQPVLSESLS